MIINGRRALALAILLLLAVCAIPFLLVTGTSVPGESGPAAASSAPVTALER
jgi:hypothetical protein